jgi:hypothetical protein
MAKWFKDMRNWLSIKAGSGKKCFLCGKVSKLNVYECCNHTYCAFCFSEHNAKFHVDQILDSKPKQKPKIKRTISNNDYTVIDPVNKGVMRYRFGKKPLTKEEKHQKELEDGYRW